jgi:hypothetical protein
MHLLPSPQSLSSQRMHSPEGVVSLESAVEASAKPDDASADIDVEPGVVALVVEPLELLASLVEPPPALPPSSPHPRVSARTRQEQKGATRNRPDTSQRVEHAKA